MIKPILCLLVTLTVASAQQIILPNDKMEPAERANYKQRVGVFQAERIRREPLFMESAQMATQKLGDAILKGNMDFAVLKMYPRWKKKQSILVGGDGNMLKKFAHAAKLMRDSGTVITDFKALRATEILYVRMEKKKGLTKVYYPVDYTFQKLVVVPTVTQIRFGKIDPATGKPFEVEKKSFQLAIYDENVKDWSFIDGSSVSINDIRNMFPTVPLSFEKKLPKGGAAKF